MPGHHIHSSESTDDGCTNNTYWMMVTMPNVYFYALVRFNKSPLNRVGALHNRIQSSDSIDDTNYMMYGD